MIYTSFWILFLFCVAGFGEIYHADILGPDLQLLAAYMKVLFSQR